MSRARAVPYLHLLEPAALVLVAGRRREERTPLEHLGVAVCERLLASASASASASVSTFAATAAAAAA